MNELGIVLVLLFALILIFIVFNRGLKSFFSPPVSSSENPQASSSLNQENSLAVSPKTSVATDAVEDEHPDQTAFAFEFNQQSDIKSKASSTEPKQKTPEHPSEIAETPSDENTGAKLKISDAPNEHGGKHFVLEVDDPAMTGELDETKFPPMYEMPKFGRPDEFAKQNSANYQEEIKQPIESAPDPKAFVLVIKSSQNIYPMERVHQIMRALGAKLNDKNLYTYATKAVQGDGYVTIANLIEPGIFPTENIENINTPGVVLILELPTFVTAASAMHDMIMLARKLVGHFQGHILNDKFEKIKESDLQSMREQSLEYDSKRIVS